MRRFRCDDDGEVEKLEVVVTDPDLPPRVVAPLTPSVRSLVA